MKLAMIVLSCDKYSDIWDSFFFRLYDKWPDIPYQVYLLTNKLEYNKYNVKSICVGEDITWSANLKKALDIIDEEYVLTVFDDLFLKDKVDSKYINKLVARFIKSNMNYLRLNPLPMPTGDVDKDNIGIVNKRELYRSSAVFSIWNKNILIDILEEKENAWQFEIIGSKRTDKYDNWYSCTKYTLPFYNLIIKGKYDLKVYRILQSEKVLLSNKRPIMTRKEYALFRMKKLRSKMFQYFIPWSLQRNIRQRFNDFSSNGK